MKNDSDAKERLQDLGGNHVEDGMFSGEIFEEEWLKHMENHYSQQMPFNFIRQSYELRYCLQYIPSENDPSKRRLRYRLCLHYYDILRLQKRYRSQFADDIGFEIDEVRKKTLEDSILIRFQLGIKQSYKKSLKVKLNILSGNLLMLKERLSWKISILERRLECSGQYSRKCELTFHSIYII
jgi:hypothetical protein